MFLPLFSIISYDLILLFYFNQIVNLLIYDEIYNLFKFFLILKNSRIDGKVKYNILLIDDELDIILTLKGLLEGAGIKSGFIY
jgi:hypothetical protein